ncbi:MAG TPA: uroporphyrinogen-III synthase [Epsilonproteobacteria bacterium]|nr:uroporphyrinogen-III synthase [Campylobacterota bacterium]
MQRTIYLLSPLVKEETISLPMIEFSLVADSIDLSSCNTLMFTSKQAVKSAEEINPKWKELPCLAIGSATARQIKSLGGTVCYQSTSFYGESLGHDIIEKFHNKKILYLRPKEISFDSKALLAKHDIVLEEQIIYETHCKHYPKKEKPIKNAIIVFTSPSTIECFFKNFVWDESYTAIVIGKSTKNHLPQYVSFVVANEPTIDACLHKANEILLTSNSK